MQLLTAQCPHCGGEVETTIEHITGPIVCPRCEKPFEMEIPTTKVTSVREVADSSDSRQLAAEPTERTLTTVHPVVFRAHPLGTLIVLAVSSAAIYGVALALMRNDTTEHSSFAGIPTPGAVDWPLWISIFALIAMGVWIFGWYMQSISTTLTLTDSRTILRKGLFRRDSSEVQHDDVRNIQVDQSFFQRLLRIGDIGISSSGQDDLEIVIRQVSAPSRIVETIRENQN